MKKIIFTILILLFATNAFALTSSYGADNFTVKSLETGLVDGTIPVIKFGFNPDTGTSFTEVWDVGTVYAYQTVAAKIRVYSTGVDTGAGTGANTVWVQGVDGNYNLIEETFTLDSATGYVESTQSFFRVFRSQVLVAGSGNVNANDIDIKNTAGSVTYARIAASNGQTLMALYTVPAGYTAYVIGWNLSSPKLVDIESHLEMRSNNGVNGSWQIKDHQHVYQSVMIKPYSPYLTVVEKTDIRIRAKTSTGTQECSAGFDLVLVKN